MTTIKRSIFAVIAGVCLLSNVTAKETLKIAVPAFLTGPAAGAYGIPGRNGAELVLNAINEGTLPPPYNSAGFAGTQVEFGFVDEAGGNTRQVTEYRNLVQKREVDAVIGYVSSGSCAALTPVIEELKTLTVFVTCATPRTFEEAPRHYIFRTMSHATADSVAAALYVHDHFPLAKQYTGLNQNYAFGQDSWRDFTAAIRVLMPEMQASDSPLFPKIFAAQYGTEISTLLLDEATLVHSSYWGSDLEGLIFQGTPRGLFKHKRFIFTVGGSSAYRLQHQMPAGIVLGARGPYGILVRDRDTVMNKWFIHNYRQAYDEYPNDAAYQYAQGVLAAKIAYDNAAAVAGRFPTQDEVIEAFTRLDFESFSTHVRMALADGHQAITENGFGITALEDGELVIKDIKFYPAECVNPPPGVNSLDWIEGGMAGAKCDAESSDDENTANQ